MEEQEMALGVYASTRGVPIAIPRQRTGVRRSTVSPCRILIEILYDNCSSTRRSLRSQYQQQKTNNLTTRNLTVEEKDVQLRRKITIWWSIQVIYMPCVSCLRAPVADATTGDDSEHEEAGSAVDMELLLPDKLPDAERSALPQGVVDKYLRLRLAQADDALSSLKRHLRKGATLRQHQEEHVAGTGVAANTRMQTAIRNQSLRQELDADRYRAARAALLKLDPAGAWRLRLLELRQNDIRPPFARAGSERGTKRADLDLEGSTSGNEGDDEGGEDGGEGQLNIITFSGFFH